MKAMKYLGVWLDDKLIFKEQVKRAVVKVEKMVSALPRILPNPERG